MITKNSPGLYPWSEDLEASSDVRLREREGFAMLLGWKVTVQKVSFAPQKQGLNALVFSFKEGCGMDEVDEAVIDKFGILDWKKPNE